MDNKHGGVVFADGFLFGTGDKAKGWYCLDFKTGAQKYRVKRNLGTVTRVEDRLYFMGEKGLVELVKVNPDKHEVVGTFQAPRGGKHKHWAHLVIAGGRMYLRHADKIFVYDVKGK